jgi:hypothetical protein
MIQCQRWIIRKPLEAGIKSSELPTGEYSNETLISGARRLATLIANCESYYPRPRQVDVYPSFKRGYEQSVEEVLTESGQGVEMSGAYVEGVEAFFEEYEKLDREKLERWAKRAKRTVS